ncbi:MAG: AAA family ATPase [Burkholderiaceae bacterium]|nr:AAA family ATPase [Burkholderiaceae bacterium]
MPRIWVDQLTFSDGSTFSLGNNDVILIVGPNNAGKSATLRTIRDKLAKGAKSPVVSDLHYTKEGDVAAVEQWLRSVASISDQESKDPTFRGFDTQLSKSAIPVFWGRNNQLNALTRFFCHFLSAESRLTAAAPAPMIDFLSDPLSHPIHYLYHDAKLEKRLSDQFRKAFGVGLVLNRLAGKQLPLHVGDAPELPKEGNRLGEHARQLLELPPLHLQGDGMRSFAGVLLQTSVGQESVLLVDEPEAFLHPPQARQLGKMLVADKPDTRQLFVATHSGDVVRGVLDAGASNVRVVRLQRDGDINRARQLENDKIAELWNDPLLRYSNILDGLFHERVVVCEGDADARFYSAVADSIAEAEDPNGRRPDAMFVHCGGKDRCALVVRALREVDVPIAVAVDFDVLNAERPLRDIVEAAGGDWSLIASDLALVRSAIESKKAELNAKEVREEIEKVLAGMSDGAFPKEAKTAIQALFRRSSPWAIAKDTGKYFVPSGDPTQAFARLAQALRNIGIHVVEVGELEKFVPSVGMHGPKWVNHALKKDLKNDPELGPARDFVRRLIS